MRRGEGWRGRRAESVRSQSRRVLLDVAMPNLNGIDAAEIIKKYLPAATIYFVTQYDSLEMARATAEVGARGYISKVHIPTDLVPAIEAAVDFPPTEVKP